MADTANDTIPQDLLDILACPRCRASVELLKKNSGAQGLACAPCGVVYPVEEGIPVMLVDAAIPREKWNAQP